MLKNNKWYSLIVVTIIIWFLLLLTWSVYKLISSEVYDTIWRNNYLKAYYWAEWAREFVLLTLKQKWYWYDESIEFDKKDSYSNILNYNEPKISKPLISYSINSKTKTYSWDLESLWYDIFPLFYIDRSWTKQAKNINLQINSWPWENLSWNIISKESWLSWTWNIAWDSTIWLIKSLDWTNFSLQNQQVNAFLNDNSSNYNYLVLFNSDNSNVISYDLTSSDFFSKPRTTIFVSSKLNDYKQNFSINYDNTKYMWLLKYAIFDN